MPEEGDLVGIRLKTIELQISDKALRSLRSAQDCRGLAGMTAGIQESVIEKILGAISEEAETVIIAYKEEIER